MTVPDYHIDMLPISETDQTSQTWFFRYDCIVSASDPCIALGRDMGTDMLAVGYFQASSNQVIEPITTDEIKDGKTERYILL